MNYLFFSYLYKLMIKCLIVIILLGLQPVTAQDLSGYRHGWVLYKLDRFREASESWQHNLDGILVKNRDAENLKNAGFAEVLITIALEKADDATAYQHWSNAVRYYLEGNTRWDTEQQRLKRYYEDKATALSLASNDRSGSVVNDDALQFLEMESALELSSYQGPRSGLQNIYEAINEEGNYTSSNTNHGYISRPGVFFTAEGKESISDNNIELNGGFDSNIYNESQENDEISTSEIFGRGIQRDSVTSYDFDDTESTGSRRSGLRGLSDTALTTIENFDEELKIAKVAWSYFENNTQAKTGLYNSVNGYEYTTMWSLGSSIAALACAHKLGIVNDQEFSMRIGALLETLNNIPLYKNELPNREYYVNTARMIDINNKASNMGSGWSAIDIGRLLIWLKIMHEWHPETRDSIKSFIGRLSTKRVSFEKQLNGVFLAGLQERAYQEGRFGYEQYAATGYLLWNIPVTSPFSYKHLKHVNVSGVSLPVDSRSSSYLTSEPFILSTLELGGLSSQFSQYVNLVYMVQKYRADEVGHWVILSEDTFDKEPWFLYNTIYANDTPWATVTDGGKILPDLRNMSVKAAFAWHAIYDDAYSKSAYEKASQAFSPKHGYYSGIYPDDRLVKAISANTNAVILESLLYKLNNQKAFLSIDVEKLLKKIR